MTPPNQNNELAKAIEEVIFGIQEHNRMITRGGHFYPVSETSLEVLINAAKRSQELEKERDDANNECAVRNDEVYGLIGQLKERDGFVRLQESLMQDKDKQLSTLTTEYKKALEALQQSISIAEDALDYRPDDEDGGRWQTIKSGLTTPLAISVMKGEV